MTFGAATEKARSSSFTRLEEGTVKSNWLQIYDTLFY